MQWLVSGVDARKTKNLSHSIVCNSRYTTLKDSIGNDNTTHNRTLTMTTYELILAEYFGLPENHKHYNTTMEFDTQTDYDDNGQGELIVTDAHIKIFADEDITTEDLVKLGNEFLPERDQWCDVQHMLSVFSEELND